MTPDDVRAMLAFVGEHRTASAPLDVAVTGFIGDMPPADAASLLDRYAAAGLTWWQEGFLPQDVSLDAVRERIRRGPRPT